MSLVGCLLLERSLSVDCNGCRNRGRQGRDAVVEVVSSGNFRDGTSTASGNLSIAKCSLHTLVHFVSGKFFLPINFCECTASITSFSAVENDARIGGNPYQSDWSNQEQHRGEP